MATHIRPLTAHDLDETVAAATVPLVVDVWAAWCRPCTMLDAVLDTVADELGDAIEIRSLDHEAHPDVARRFGVMSLPTLLVFHNGEPVKRIVGAKGKNQLLEDLADLLG